MMVERNASVHEPSVELALTLVQQASLLTRLVFRHADAGMSRSEASLLARLEAGPQRVTALAEHEGLAQPTITRLVKHLEKRGWARRERAPDDGRIVLVSSTAEGRSALGHARSRIRLLLRSGLAELSEAQAAALEEATDAIESLVDALQRGGA